MEKSDNNDGTSSVHDPTKENINVNEAEDEILEKMKGDAIGETLYSERFVLKTILQLPSLEKLVSDDEVYEKDLCNLWDMTIEVDVVNFLLEQDVVELFAGIIKSSEDDRLIEILVGIIGNMCSVTATITKLFEKEETIMALLDLIESSDTLSLVQYMRFLTMLFTKAGPKIHLLNYLKNVANFGEKFAFIFGNTMNTELLEQSFDTLKEILYRTEEEYEYDNELYKIFENTSFIDGVREGFRLLFPPSSEEENFDEDSDTVLSKKEFKMMTTFVETNCTFKSNTDNDLADCLSRILFKMSSPSAVFSVSKMKTDIFENIDILLTRLGHPFEVDLFVPLVKTYLAIEQQISNKSDWDKNEEEAGGYDGSKLLLHNVLDMLAKIISNAVEYSLTESLRTSPLDENSLNKLCANLKTEIDCDYACSILEKCSRLAWAEENHH